MYSSTKVFVRNYTRALNVELKDKGINVIAVCPG
ncbi:SDR family NAD(P)-dependent oxidoreductase [Clostridioides sp. ES-S-0054-01]